MQRYLTIRSTFAFKILMMETLNFSTCPFVPHISDSLEFSYPKYALFYLIYHTLCSIRKCIFEIKAIFLILVFLLVHFIYPLQLLQIKFFLLKYLSWRNTLHIKISHYSYLWQNIFWRVTCQRYFLCSLSKTLLTVIPRIQ